MLAMTIVPSPLEDEPVASYFKRCALLNLLGSPHSMAARGLGAPWRQLDIALPTHLAIFAEVVSQFIPEFDLATCIAKHTQFPYYASTLSEEQRFALRLRMAKSSYGPVGPIRPLNGHRSADSILPFCDECRLCDIATHGFAYVHRTSNLPLVTHCVWHRLPLRYVTLDTSNIGSTGDGARFNSTLFATISAEMLRKTEPYLHLRDRFDFELTRARWVSPGKRVAVREMARHVHNVYSDGFASAQLSEFVASVESILEWLRPAFLSRPFLHPAHLALLIGAFRIAAPEPRQNTPARPLSHRRGDTTPIVSALYDSDTITEAARKCGYSVTTVATVARNEGIPFQERPKRITPGIRRRVQKALKKGNAIDKVCRSFDISMSTAYRLIRSSREVLESRSQVLKSKERSNRRLEWTRLIDAKPHAGRNALRTLEPATFAWLYKHDRSWLMHQLAPAAKRHDDQNTIRTGAVRKKQIAS
jgi:hypothetical protein